MATLLALCQEIARRTGVDVPDTIIGNRDDVAARLLGAASRSARWIVKQHTWSALAVEGQITTVVDQATYSFPDGFDRIIAQTAWDAANNWPIRAVVSPAERQWWDNAISSGAQGRRIISFIGKNIHVYPTPTVAGQALTFEYITKNWCESSAGGGQDNWTSDTDVYRLDQTLLEYWMEANFLKSVGMPYLDERSDAEKLMSQLKGQDTPGPALSFDTSPRRMNGFEERALAPALGGLKGA